MAPVIPPLRAAYDVLQCMGIGLLAAMLRCLFPAGRRPHFWADFLCVGAAAVLLQGFAASRSGAGMLRWYMILGAALGAAASEAVLRPLRSSCLRAASLPFRLVYQKCLCPAAEYMKMYQKAQKKGKVHKNSMSKRKKELQKHGTVLYNSNV